MRGVRHALALTAARRRARRAEQRDAARRDLAPLGHFELDGDLARSRSTPSASS